MLNVETLRRITLPIAHVSARDFYTKLVRWGFEYPECFVFDSGGYTSDRFYRYDWLIMVDAVHRLSWSEVAHIQPSQVADWMGFLLPYDFKQTLLGHLNSGKVFFEISDGIFFIPRWVFYSKNGKVFAELREPDVHKLPQILAFIDNQPDHVPEQANLPAYRAHTGKEEYLAAFEKVVNHLLRGDIYEMNYCVYYSSRKPIDDIPGVWLKISSQKGAPMSGLFKFGSTCVLSQSPERFFTLRSSTIYSQPIKGTIRRGLDTASDDSLKKKLFESTKERAENVMIVDLVRNDISRISEPGSICVEELFGIHTFAKVHQMISTISGKLSENVTLEQIFKALFPMGSMTGAPKLSAMNIIRQVESHDRGIYSGTAGYIDPKGDMDCNVIIRSIVTDLATGISYIGVGSAVTVYANAEDEYQECLLKLTSVTC
ncbi:para-aminobenzoate synthase [Thermaurantimonas aggregans]|uniref:Para-aminobenzoate synthase n=1 Tax=Thermaurantimonas aggregans TaxID=2173829 RepID=A0A401XJ46_9FLAO|nr:anthranilate synthase component I family protein [Thermaurantimonas aggregans]GCD77049.1 para-aminobenzoate synthase [Thermaurantimonas aggregans]